jgi:hypothetical protein
MAQTLHARGTENHDMPALLPWGIEAAAPPPAPPRPALELGEVMAPPVRRLKALLPGLTQADQRFILWGHNHLETFPDYRHGMFTLRNHVVRGSHCDTVMTSIEKGKKHTGVFLFSVAKCAREEDEIPLFLFIVNLALAVRFSDAALPRVNKAEGNGFWLFDWRNPVTQIVARRFEL